MTEIRDRQLEYTYKMRDHLANYHNHKENMGWLGLGAQFVLAAFIADRGEKIANLTRKHFDQGMAVVLLILIYWIAWGILHRYIAWQLSNKALSAAESEACEKVIFDLLEGKIAEGSKKRARTAISIVERIRQMMLSVLSLGAWKKEIRAKEFPTFFEENLRNVLTIERSKSSGKEYAFPSPEFMERVSVMLSFLALVYGTFCLWSFLMLNP